MTKLSTHIIHKQNIDLFIEDEESAFSIQNRISKICNHDVKNRLDKIFTNFSVDDNHIVIDKLEIDIGTVDVTNLENDVPRRIIDLIENELKKITVKQSEIYSPKTSVKDFPGAVKNNRTSAALIQPGHEYDSGTVKLENLKIVNSSDRVTELFFYFLEFGHFPWWASSIALTEIEEKILAINNKDNLTISLKELLIKSTTIVNRLLLQFSDDFTSKIINLLFSKHKDIIKSFYETLLTTLQTENESVNKKVFSLFYKHKLFSLIRQNISIDTFSSGVIVKKLVNLIFKELRDNNRNVEFNTVGLLQKITKDVLKQNKTEADNRSIFTILFEDFKDKIQFANLSDQQIADIINDLLTNYYSTELDQMGSDGSRKAVQDLLKGKSSPSNELSLDLKHFLLKLLKHYISEISSSLQTDKEIKDAFLQIIREFNLYEYPGKKNKGHVNEKNQDVSSISGKNDQSFTNDNFQDNSKLSDKKDQQTINKNTEDVTKRSESKDFKKRDEKEESSSSIFITNAGLVLLAPFFSSFFKSLKLIEKNGFHDELSSNKAVHISQFLVNEQTSTIEAYLVLNKILCGIEITDPILNEIELSENEISECNDLLNSVIKNWSILKNTSPDAFRETFLQREGILTRQDTDWKLQIERKTLDIVLNYIPWSYSIIKLPWMGQMLFVEW